MILVTFLNLDNDSLRQVNLFVEGFLQGKKKQRNEKKIVNFAFKLDEGTTDSPTP